MKYLVNMKLPYSTVRDGSNLYDDIDLMSEDIIRARYWTENGYSGNPDICALPRPATGAELQILHTLPMKGYDEAKAALLSPGQKKREILSLRNVRFPFPFHMRIDQYFSAALIGSYASRRIGITERPELYYIGETEKRAEVITADKGIAANAMGFSVTGTAGSGKSTAFELVLSRYPKVILHNFPEYSYVQIPYVPLTAFANGNLQAVFARFADYIDERLDTKMHAAALNATRTLGLQAALIATWIKRYHIGAIIIDEIQLMDFSASSANSMENLLSITASTGVALVLIGTQDASSKWRSTLRLDRRTEGWSVRTDDYCKQKDFLRPVIQKLMRYQWTDRKAEPNEELIDAIYEESCGSIDMITLIWMTAQFEAVSNKKQPIVDAAYIRKISEQRFRNMQKLIQASLTESEQRYRTERSKMIDQMLQSAQAEEDRKIAEEMKADCRANVRDHYNREYELGKVMEAIQYGSETEYSEQMIQKAYISAEKKEGFKAMTIRGKAQLVLRILHDTDRRKVRRERKSKQETDKENNAKTYQGLNISELAKDVETSFA